MVRPTTCSAGSGTTGRRRIRRWSPAAVLGEDDSWRRCRAPAVEWFGVDDVEGYGGSSGPIGEARDGRWPRYGSSELAGVSAMVERAKGRRGGEWWGGQSDPDGSGGSVRGATQASRQEVAQARVCAWRARARRPSGAVETTTGVSQLVWAVLGQAR